MGAHTHTLAYASPVPCWGSFGGKVCLGESLSLSSPISPPVAFPKAFVPPFSNGGGGGGSHVAMTHRGRGRRRNEGEDREGGKICEGERERK